MIFNTKVISLVAVVACALGAQASEYHSPCVLLFRSDRRTLAAPVRQHNDITVTRTTTTLTQTITRASLTTVTAGATTTV